MLLIVVLFLFLFTMLYDSLTCLRRARARERAVYFVLMFISLGILIPHSLNITLPSPATAITNVLKAILKLD